MRPSEVQEKCERGQELLVGMDYLGAEKVLSEAEVGAWGAGDWDAIARLYMPLQEARRQRRQRCGEGVVRMDIWEEAGKKLEAERIVAEYPHGQLLVAGMGSIKTAVEVRKLRERGLYLETFLGAVYPVGVGKLVVIVPTEDVLLPAGSDSVDAIVAKLPVGSVVWRVGESRVAPDKYKDPLPGPLPEYRAREKEGREGGETPPLRDKEREKEGKQTRSGRSPTLQGREEGKSGGSPKFQGTEQEGGLRELRRGERTGNTQTFGEVMDLWERLHRPFLAAADAAVDPLTKMEGYRKTIRVDYACELAHQKLADVARELGRRNR